MGKPSRKDIAYKLSLNPSYIDTYLCKHTPDTGSGNEVDEFEDCLYPLQFLIENQIKVHHSGWIYIATCLIFEKPISRGLASEYIHLALSKWYQELDYLADVIGELIALKYAPINRLIEFIDNPTTSKKVKQFQQKLLERTIHHFNKEKLPINTKKIITAYKEITALLKMEIEEEIQTKIKSLKK